MATYEYRCLKCGHRQDEMHEPGERLSLLCPRCNEPLQWQFPCPALQTDTNFVRGNDDGFGRNSLERGVAHRAARSVGINPTGKRYCGQLARKGLGFRDPEAWVESKEDIRRVAQRRGMGVEGCVNVPVREREEAPGPYKVADSIVEHVAEDKCLDAGFTPTPKEFEKIKADIAAQLQPHGA